MKNSRGNVPMLCSFSIETTYESTVNEPPMPKPSSLHVSANLDREQVSILASGSLSAGRSWRAMAERPKRVFDRLPDWSTSTFNREVVGSSPTGLIFTSQTVAQVAERFLWSPSSSVVFSDRIADLVRTSAIAYRDCLIKLPYRRWPTRRTRL